MTHIDIVSGFLGAGKTTFIKRLIGPERTVVIENEFGEISIDGDVLRSEDLETVEINSGCICCVMRKEMVTTLDRILTELSPERIIIEPTGISMLSEVVRIADGKQFRGRCRIRSCTAVVDCASFLDQIEDFGEFFTDQISHASLIVLSKTSGADDDTLHRIAVELRLLNAGAPICMDDWRDMSRDDIEAMIKSASYAAQQLHDDCGHEHEHDHSHEHEHEHDHGTGRFSSFSARAEIDLTPEELTRKVEATSSGEHGRVLRGKGFVRVGGQLAVFDLVGGKLSFAPTDSDSETKICFIGEHLDVAAIRRIWLGGED